MTRVFVDTRSCWGWREAANMAGALDLDIVALVADNGPNLKAVNRIKRKLRKVSKVSKVRTVEISYHTVDAVDVVRDLAHSNDVIVTDSCLLALEFMKKVGAAVNNRGYEYTDPEILDQVVEFYRCQELKRQGKYPYSYRKYTESDRMRLRQSLVRILAVVCGISEQEVLEAWKTRKRHAKLNRANDKDENDARLVSADLPALELRASTKVYVDGDACPVLPEIVELCGSAGVPVVYVSNMHQKNLIAKACKANPGLPSRMRRVPEITQVTVPVRKDAADKLIRTQIHPHDIALTNDIGLMANCLNKDAMAIDYQGRVYVRLEGGVIGKAAVRWMRGEQRPANGSCDRVAFRESLQKALEKYPSDGCQVEAADECQIIALEIARRQGRVTTRKLCEQVGAGSWVCLRALRDLTSKGVLEWHGSSTHDPTQFYSLAC